MLSWVVLIALTQQAPPPRVALHHALGPGAAGCPDQAWLEGNVAARLGYSPFVADAPLAANTRFDCDAAGCRGTLELTGKGQPPRRRSMAFSDCRELAESMALTLALAIDPQHTTRPAPAPEPPATAPPAAAAPPAPAPVAPPPPAAPPEPTHFIGQLGVMGTYGLSPGINGGVRVAGGVRHGWFSASLEGRVDFPQTLTVDGGTVSSSVLLGTVVPCVHKAGFGFCLTASFGALQVSGQLSSGNRQSSFLSLVGVRVSWQYLFLSWLGVVVHAGAQGVLTRVTVLANGQPAWVTSPLAPDVGAGVLVQW